MSVEDQNNTASHDFERTTLVFLDREYRIRKAPAKTTCVLFDEMKATWTNLVDGLVESTDLTEEQTLALWTVIPALENYPHSGFPVQGSLHVDVEAFYAMLQARPRRTVHDVLNEHQRQMALAWEERKLDELPYPRVPSPASAATLRVPAIDDIWLFGTVDRCLSELKYILDHPSEFDEATWQTFKHHVEDMGLFFKHATGKLEKLGKIASLPPVGAQHARGY
jgi:hypothetical protein